jgi:hypothetical protein
MVIKVVKLLILYTYARRFPPSSKGPFALRFGSAFRVNSQSLWNFKRIRTVGWLKSADSSEARIPFAARRHFAISYAPHADQRLEQLTGDVSGAAGRPTPWRPRPGCEFAGTLLDWLTATLVKGREIILP